jgi:hypothetical protein
MSHRGQTNLPYELHHQWGIERGGELGIVKPSDAALVIPGGIQSARNNLRRVGLSLVWLTSGL